MNNRFSFIKVHPTDKNYTALRRTRWISVRFIKHFWLSDDKQGSDMCLGGETLSVKESPEQLLELIGDVDIITNR